MAMVVDAFAEVFAEKLLDLAAEHISRILGVRDDLLKLKSELEHFTGVAANAESRKIREDPIRQWVAELREVLYDADDLLDDCRIEGNRLLSASSLKTPAGHRPPTTPCITPGSLLSFFRDLFFRSEIATRIRRIKKQLGTLSSRISALHLVHLGQGVAAVAAAGPVPRPFAPLVADEDIVGIDEDAGGLVDLVIMGERGREKKRSRCPIYAITGMPGIGKTTLSQKVSNDPQVKSHFEATICVCVSREYNPVDLLKEIGRCMKRKEGREDTIRAESYNEAAPVVRELLDGKRLLLVLDDVWDAKVWDLLGFPLSSAADGSCVLVTTRNEGVAQEMKAQYFHRARVLTDKEGWLMLRKQVFGDDDGGGNTNEIETLERTGMEIVGKCKGLPLAIKAIAGMLKKRERTVRAWENVRDSSTWQLENLGEDIKPGLLLSYEDLLPHLKQCFLYCSLFPEDYRFHHQTLVQMWIAQSLVKRDGGRSLEEIGEDYYRELVMRNLLQAAPEYYDGRGCTMHDLLRSLAKHVLRSGSTKTRHLFFVKQEKGEVPDVDDKECLRTILLSKNLQITSIPPGYFAKLRHLRVLDLTHTGIKSLPESLGDLVQLRFLNVAFTKIRELPESIGMLLNLETLKANDLKHLEGLPRGITQLQSLRHLVVGSAKKQLSSMPVGIGKLRSLRTLSGFVVNDGSEQDMGELEKLCNIGHISMYRLDKVAGKEAAQAAKLDAMENLVFLRLSCTRREKEQQFEEAEMVRIGDVFEGLNPPDRLEALHIDGFFGYELPTCIKGCSLRNLNWLRLDDCKFIERLPPLGQLPNLRALHIWGAISVSKIGPEFFGSTFGSVGFPSLQEFYLKGMTKLKEIASVGPGTLPRLKKLQVIRCPKLGSLPEGLEYSTKLAHLLVEDAESITSITNLKSASELKLSNNSKLNVLAGLQSLKFLTISNCHALEKVNCSDELSYLSVLDDKIVALPEWLKHITSLRRLNVKGNRELVTRCVIRGSEWALLEHVPHVEVRTVDGSSYISYSKDPFIFQSNLTEGHPADLPPSTSAKSAFDAEEDPSPSFRSPYDP